MKEGYVSLTYPYTLPEEEEEFERAVAQLKKGNRDYLVYQYEDTAEIYVRSGEVVPFDKEAGSEPLP